MISSADTCIAIAPLDGFLHFVLCSQVRVIAYVFTGALQTERTLPGMKLALEARRHVVRRVRVSCHPSVLRSDTNLVQFPRYCRILLPRRTKYERTFSRQSIEHSSDSRTLIALQLSVISVHDIVGSTRQRVVRQSDKAAKAGTPGMASR